MGFWSTLGSKMSGFGHRLGVKAKRLIGQLGTKIANTKFVREGAKQVGKYARRASMGLSVAALGAAATGIGAPLAGAFGTAASVAAGISGASMGLHMVGKKIRTGSAKWEDLKSE